MERPPGLIMTPRDDPLSLSGTPRFDPGIPHSARIYNVWLGGKDGLAADRKAAAEVAACRPQVVAGAQANRAFLARTVRYLAGPCGIRQFLDIGPGLPAPDSTHEVAQAIAPESKIVYVDNDRCKSDCAHLGRYTYDCYLRRRRGHIRTTDKGRPQRLTGVRR
jgi:hypothetical protein